MMHYVPSNVSFSQPTDRSFCNAYMINGDAENIITFSIEIIPIRFSNMLGAENAFD